ncbi:MAG: CpaF family protein [Planctomycetota bacterium]
MNEKRTSLKTKVCRTLIDELDLHAAQSMPVRELREECRQRADLLLQQQDYPLTESEKQDLLYDILNDIFGLGPLEEFMDDPEVSDILVNGYNNIYIERGGQLQRTDARFRDNNHLMQVIQRIATQVGRRIDESAPMLDARLMDGSRVNAIIPPLSLSGPALSVRRFGTIKMNIDKLIDIGTLPEEIALFLKECVRCRLNIVISGGTGAGKTTLLNVLSTWIPQNERLVTIEDAAELQLQREHVVRLETRPPNIEGKGEVNQRELLRNSLRMRPDRIIIGEVRGPETLDMLQAMNTGHEGSLTTIHSNSTRDALARIENMVSMAGLNYPIRVIRNQMASALDLLVHVDRLTGGKRRLMEVAEISGLEGDVVTMHDLFRYTQTGIDEQGAAEGYFEACGTRPALLERLEAEGAKLPQDMFRNRVLE